MILVCIMVSEVISSLYVSNDSLLILHRRDIISMGSRSFTSRKEQLTNDNGALEDHVSSVLFVS